MTVARHRLAGPNARRWSGSSCHQGARVAGGRAGLLLGRSGRAVCGRVLGCAGHSSSGAEFCGRLPCRGQELPVALADDRWSGTSTLQVREISFASAGDSSFAARFSATKGALEGFELIQAGAQSGDVLVGMTFVGLDPAEAEQATQDAVAKVEDKLGTSGSI